MGTRIYGIHMFFRVTVDDGNMPPVTYRQIWNRLPCQYEAAMAGREANSKPIGG